MALAWYGSMLTRYPLGTKMVTSGILGFLGDGLCQSFEGSKSIFKKTK